MSSEYNPPTPPQADYTFLVVALLAPLLGPHSMTIATPAIMEMGMPVRRPQHLHGTAGDLETIIAMAETLKAATTGDTDDLVCKNYEPTLLGA